VTLASSGGRLDWKRKLEITFGLLTGVLGVIVLSGILYEEHLIAVRLQEPTPIGDMLVLVAFYGMPILLVVVGGYTHAKKRQSLGRVLLIAATLFLVVMFFLSLVVLVWSGWVWPIASLTLLAILTSITSLLVRREQ